MDLSILNKLFDKVFVITLEHEMNADKFVSVDGLQPTGGNRKERFQQRFENLEYEFFYGVDGSKCGFENVEITKDGCHIVKPQNLTFGQIGCSMSHVKLYELIANSEWEKVLILEDDCLFLPEIENVENYLSQVPLDWGMIYLGWVGNVYEGNLTPNVYKITKNSFIHLHCTHSIAITKDFARKMADFNNECYYTADGAFSEIVKQKNEVCYAITPNLSKQEVVDCVSYEIDLKYKKI